MRGALQFFRGRVTVVFAGAEPEGFLNLCAKEGILFWGVERRDRFTMALETTRAMSRRLEPLAQKTQCTLVLEHPRGLPYFLLGFRKRYALLAGAVVCVLGLCVLSRFVWTIDVQGNETVSTAEILTELRRQGLKIGTYVPAIDPNDLANKSLLVLDDLSFLAVNFHGARAEVIVREKGFLPDLVQEDLPTHVVAAADGVITRMEVRRGQAKFKIGDAVMKGEILLSGIVDIREPEYAQIDLGTYSVHAQGRVMATTWRNLTAEIPLNATVKDYTGRKEHGLTLRFLGKRLKIFGNGGISFAEYDRITEITNATLPDGTLLPFGLEWETNREYVPKVQPIVEEEGEAMLQAQLLAALTASLDEGEILSAEFVTSREAGFLRVTLLAQCDEQIGRVVPVEAGEGFVKDPPVTGNAHPERSSQE